MKPVPLSIPAIILTASFCSFLSTGIAAAYENEAHQTEERGTCVFSQQLESESDRTQFTNNIKAAKEASASRYGEVQANTVQALLKNGEIMELDTFSVKIDYFL